MFFKFFKNTNGATLVEYGLIVTMLALGIIGSLNTIGEETAAPIEEVAESISDATN